MALASKSKLPPRKKRTRKPMLAVMVGAVLLFWFAVYVLTKSGYDGTANFYPKPLDLLLLRVEGKYRRELDSYDNKFSLHYKTKHPDTIIIIVRYRSNVDRKIMNETIESAKSAVRGVAADQYNLRNINIEEDIELIP